MKRNSRPGRSNELNDCWRPILGNSGNAPRTDYREPRIATLSWKELVRTDQRMIECRDSMRVNWRFVASAKLIIHFNPVNCGQVITEGDEDQAENYDIRKEVITS